MRAVWPLTGYDLRHWEPWSSRPPWAGALPIGVGVVPLFRAWPLSVGCHVRPIGAGRRWYGIVRALVLPYPSAHCDVVAIVERLQTSDGRTYRKPSWLQLELQELEAVTTWSVPEPRERV